MPLLSVSTDFNKCLKKKCFVTFFKFNENPQNVKKKAEAVKAQPLALKNLKANYQVDLFTGNLEEQ